MEKSTEILIDEIARQEALLVFEKFDSDDAWQIGSSLLAMARAQGLVYTINISLNRQQLFHFAMNGTSPDNDNWIRRKENMVYHFFASSWRKGLEFADKNVKLDVKFGLPAADYALAGGSFPITIRGVGVVGAITVSGLPQEQDHACVVAAIQAHLQHPGPHSQPQQNTRIP